MIVNIVMQFGEMKYFNVTSSVLNRYFNSSVLMVFTVSFYLLASCNNKSSQQTHTLLSHEELTGRVFIVGPGLDSASCLAYGECDCCASHYLFINAKEFIAVEYCLESDTYFKGTYRYLDNQVLFYADGLFVDKEYPIDEKMGSNNPEPEAYKIKPNKGKPINFKWLRFECKNTTSFITDETDSRFVTVDSENKFVELVQEIKNEGIWSALGMK